MFTIHDYQEPNRYQFVTLRAKKIRRQRKIEHIKTVAGEILAVVMIFAVVYLMMFI